MVWLEHAPVEADAPIINRFITHIEDIHYITNNINNTNVQNIALNLSFLNRMMVKSIETQADTVIRHSKMLSQQNFTVQDKIVNNVTAKQGDTNVVTSTNKSHIENKILNITNIKKVGELVHLTARQIISLSQDTVRQVNNLYTAQLSQQNISKTHNLNIGTDLVYHQQQTEESIVNSVVNNINTSVNNAIKQVAKTTTICKTNQTNQISKINQANRVDKEDKSTLNKADTPQEIGNTAIPKDHITSSDVINRPARHYKNTVVTQRQDGDKAKIIYSKDGRQALETTSTETIINKTQQLLKEQIQINNKQQNIILTKQTAPRHDTPRSMQQNNQNNQNSQPVGGSVNTTYFTPADIVVNDAKAKLDIKSEKMVFNNETIKQISKNTTLKAINTANITNGIDARSTNTVIQTGSVTNLTAPTIHADEFNLNNSITVLNGDSTSIHHSPTISIQGDNKTNNILQHDNAFIQHKTLSQTEHNTSIDRQTVFNHHTFKVKAQNNTINGDNTTTTDNFMATSILHSNYNLTSHTNDISQSSSYRQQFQLSTINNDTVNIQNSHQADYKHNTNIYNQGQSRNVDILAYSSTAMIAKPVNVENKTVPIKAVNMLYKQEAVEKGTQVQEQQPDDIITIKKTKKIQTNTVNETLENITQSSTGITTADNKTRQAANELLTDSIPINRIAEKVYKQLETRLRNERQRRGLN